MGYIMEAARAGVGLAEDKSGIGRPAAITTSAHPPAVGCPLDDSQGSNPTICNLTSPRRADPQAQLIVLALGAGVQLLASGANDERRNGYDAQLDPPMRDGIQLRVCGNTLEARGIGPKKLIPDVVVMTSGAAETADRGRRSHIKS